MEDDLGEEILSADMKVKVENGFPFELDVSLVLVDSVDANTFNVLEIITIGNVPSATVDVNGEVTELSTSDLSISVDQDTFDNLQLANKAYIRASASTYNDGQQAVKLYSTYEIKIGIGLNAQFNIEIE
jgi:hypothetical protein